MQTFPITNTFSKKIIASLFLATMAFNLFAGNPKKLDSLYTLLKKTASDTSKINLQLKIAGLLMKEDSAKGSHEIKKAIYLINALPDKIFALKAIDKIAKICYSNGQIQTAKSYWETALSTARKQNNTEWQTKYYVRIADMLQREDFLKQSLVYFDSALVVAKKTDEKVLADIYMKKGRVHYESGDYKTAMDLYIKSQKLFEKNELYNLDYGHLLHFIGSVFKQQKFYTKALDYYEKELELARKIKNKSLEAEALYLCASMYGTMGDLDKELDYELKAIAIFKEEGNDRMTALLLGNISVNYSDRKDYKKAIENCEAALAIYEKTGDIEQESWLYKSLGDNYSRLGEHKKAIDFLTKAMAVTLKVETKQLLYRADITESMAFAYSRMGNYKSAFDLLLEHRSLNDSLTNKDNSEYLHSLEKQYETGKKEKEIALLNKDKQMKHAEFVKQQTQRNALIIGCVLVFVIAGISIFAFINKQKTSRILSTQVNEINYQNAVIKEKNKDITDSIQYAKRLQEAVFPETDVLNSFFAESFVLFRPKDIVSGDFYWFALRQAQDDENGKQDELQIIIVGDCTGHGVPGAFMSILGHNLLSQIILEDKITDPAEILKLLDKQVTNALNKKGTKKEYNDGMDIAICIINKAENKLEFAGANRPLVIKRGEELIELKPAKFAIGGQQDGNIKLFVKQEMQIVSNDVLYLFSDGYNDQFGGPKGKKFKYRQLMSILSSIAGKPLDEQKLILDTTLETWKGNLEQVDDVCIIGVKV